MMRSYFSTLVIFLVGLVVVFSIVKYIKNQQCSEAIISLKNYLEHAVLSIKNEDANMIVKLKIPEEYSYMIFNKSGKVYLKLFSCDMEVSLDEDIKLIDNIISKREIYLVKNYSNIYISPYPFNIGHYSSYIRMINNIRDYKKIIIYLAFQVPTFSKTPTILLTKDKIKEYASDIPSVFSDFFNVIYNYTTIHGMSANFLLDYLNESNYGIFISENILYGDILPDNILPLLVKDCKKIQEKFYGFDTLIAIFVWDDPKIKIGGYVYFYPEGNYRVIEELKKNGCPIKFFFYVSVNESGDKSHNHRYLLHLLMQDMAMLAEQYKDQCRDFYLIIPDREIMISQYKLIKQVYGNIICNYLNRTKDARPLEHTIKIIEKLYADYPVLYNLVGEQSKVLDDICFGNNTIFIRVNNTYGFVVIDDKNSDGVVSLKDECKVVLIDNGPIVLNCKDFSEKYKVKNLYDINVGLCYSNQDIVGTRDLMGIVDMGYLSEESIRALVNNFRLLWKVK